MSAAEIVASATRTTTNAMKVTARDGQRIIRERLVKQYLNRALEEAGDGRVVGIDAWRRAKQGVR